MPGHADPEGPAGRVGSSGAAIGPGLLQDKSGQTTPWMRAGGARSETRQDVARVASHDVRGVGPEDGKAHGGSDGSGEGPGLGVSTEDEFADRCRSRLVSRS